MQTHLRELTWRSDHRLRAHGAANCKRSEHMGRSEHRLRAKRPLCRHPDRHPPPPPVYTETHAHGASRPARVSRACAAAAPRAFRASRPQCRPCQSSRRRRGTRWQTPSTRSTSPATASRPRAPPSKRSCYCLQTRTSRQMRRAGALVPKVPQLQLGEHRTPPTTSGGQHDPAARSSRARDHEGRKTNMTDTPGDIG